MTYLPIVKIYSLFFALYDEYGLNIGEYSFIGESYYNIIGDYDVTINVQNII